MAKLDERAPAWVKKLRCPNCGGMPWIAPPVFPWEVPQSAVECVCEVCGAQLVRDRTPNEHGGHDTSPWRLREGAPVPPDTGDWPEKARAVYEAHKARELAESRAWVAKEIEQNKCPACGEGVDLGGGRRLKKHERAGTIDAVTCQNCGADLWRTQKRVPLEYRGQKLGFSHPWKAGKV